MAKAEEEVTRATAAEYREYLQLHGQSASIKTRMEVLKEKILLDLRGGGVSPKDLPFRCAIQKRLTTAYDWKGALLKTFKFVLHLKHKEADERMEKIAAEFEKKDVEALVVEKNPEYVL